MISLRFLEGSELPKLQTQWENLYELQQQQGMLLPMPAGAFEMWLSSMEPLMGRFTMVAVAEIDEEIAGFVAGRLRTAPAYYGGQTVGYVSEVYTRPEFRNQGLGARTLQMMVDWFHEQGIHRVELHVMGGNEDGMRFYRRHGWQLELSQMVLNRPGTSR